MLNLSDASIKRTMECADNFLDRDKILRNLRKSCFRVNIVIVQNDFHKLKSGSIEFFLDKANHAYQNTKLRVSIAWEKSNDMKVRRYFEQHNVDQKNIQAKDLDRLKEAAKIFARPTKNPYLNETYLIEQSGMAVNVAVEQAFASVLLKIRIIDSMKLKCLTLDSDLANTMNKCATRIRSASSVFLDYCTILWTEDELTEFLVLFENLEEFFISGKFREPIVTDQHLLLVSKSITVGNSKYNTLYFPGITSKICDHWVKVGIRCVILCYMTTEISTDRLTTLAEELPIKQPKKGILDKRWFFNFGVMKYSEYREHILAQRNRNTEFVILTHTPRKNVCKVLNTTSKFQYTFEIERPYEEPNFEQILKSISQMRAETTEEHVDQNRILSIKEKLRKMNAYLMDYQYRNELPITLYRADIGAYGMPVREAEEEMINTSMY